MDNGLLCRVSMTNDDERCFQGMLFAMNPEGCISVDLGPSQAIWRRV